MPAGKLLSNYARNGIMGMGSRGMRSFVTARKLGDKLLANKIATFSTIAAGGVAAGALYGNDHPILGTMALAATGGLGLAAASHGHFGATARSYAGMGLNTANSVGGAGISKMNSLYRYGRMRGRGMAKGMRG